MIEFALSFVLTALSAITEPSRAECPPWMVLGGVSQSGSFRCVYDLIGSESSPLSFRPPGRVTSWVYCAEGTIPVVVGERSVACRRGRY